MKPANAADGVLCQEAGQHQVECLTIEHVSEITSLDEVCQAQMPTEESYRAELAIPWSSVEGIRDSTGRLIAFINYWSFSNEVHILNVGTHPDSRNTGLAAHLIENVIDKCRRQKEDSVILLEVRKGNQAARHLYKKLGFSEDGVREKYYENNQEDAILMSLAVSSSLPPGTP